MFDLNKKQKLFFLLYLVFKWFLYLGKKHKTNYYAKNISEKSWVSLI